MLNFEISSAILFFLKQEACVFLYYIYDPNFFGHLRNDGVFSVQVIKNCHFGDYTWMINPKRTGNKAIHLMHYDQFPSSNCMSQKTKKYVVGE